MHRFLEAGRCRNGVPDFARTLLRANRSLLAGYHNPQGRVIALLRLLQLAPDDVLAILPRELVGPVAQPLVKFILRAKVQLTDESAHWTITGLLLPVSSSPVAPCSPAPHAGARSFIEALPAIPNGTVRVDGSLAVRLGEEPPRWLLIGPAPASPPAQLAHCVPVTEEVWRRCANTWSRYLCCKPRPRRGTQWPTSWTRPGWT